MQNMPEESQSQTPMQSAQQIVAQTVKLPGLSKKIIWAAMPITVKAMWRQRRNPLSAEEQEKIIEDLRKVGVTDAHLPFTLLIINSVGRGLRDQEEIHRLDRYLVGGCAILDLVLLSILASSTSDVAVHVSGIALAIALPCTAGSLCFSFLRNNPKRYGEPHSTLSALAILSTIISATTLIWHFWAPAGTTFLIASLIVALVSLSYETILILRKHLVSKPSASPAEQEIIYD
jgi:cation transport ATPase